MEATLFLRNKINRHIQWNGQDFTFIRYKRNEYKEFTEEIDKRFSFKGIFHDGGGYGGMLNFELLERDGSRIVTKMKPMIMCSYEDGRNIERDDVVAISDAVYRVVDKQNVKNLDIAFEISLEEDKGE